MAAKDKRAKEIKIARLINAPPGFARAPSIFQKDTAVRCGMKADVAGDAASGKMEFANVTICPLPPSISVQVFILRGL
jgi:hypothetical protein